MNRKPFISVIVSTHKRPVLLQRCLESILRQNIPNEIILCADEGSHETKLVANKLLREADTFVVTPYKKGPASTRNVGVTLANGEWICYLDDDDTFEENYFEKVNEILLRNKESINYFDYTKSYDYDKNKQEEKNSLGGININNLYVCNFIPNNALMIPSKIAAFAKIDENLKSHEDWEYLVALLDKYKFKHHKIFGPRVHIQDKNSRNQNSINTGEYLLDFIYIYRKWPGKTEEIKRARQNYLKNNNISLPLNVL